MTKTRCFELILNSWYRDSSDKGNFFVSKTSSFFSYSSSLQKPVKSICQLWLNMIRQDTIDKDFFSSFSMA